MKRLIQDALISSGYNLTKSTDPVHLSNLIKSLRPKDCGKELVRIGGNGDGGYLLPNDLQGIEYCFSPGVSAVATFENQLADMGIRSFMADYSVEAPPINRREFTFDKRFLAASENETCFTLASWKNKYLKDYSNDLLFQMDIEGSEYEVILNTPDELLGQFRIIIIELHDLNKLFDPTIFKIFNACFEKLCRQFYVVHLHPNNYQQCIGSGAVEIPPIIEATFYNKKRSLRCIDAKVFPHPLDQDNGAHLPKVPLPKCWYSD